MRCCVVMRSAGVIKRTLRRWAAGRTGSFLRLEVVRLEVVGLEVGIWPNDSLHCVLFRMYVHVCMSMMLFWNNLPANSAHLRMEMNDSSGERELEISHIVVRRLFGLLIL